MYFDEKEKFISELLENLGISELKKKDIKIQLLDKKAESFEPRAMVFLEKMDRENQEHKCSYEDYLKRCEDIEQKLIKLAGKKNVFFYKRKYFIII